MVQNHNPVAPVEMIGRTGSRIAGLLAPWLLASSALARTAEPIQQAFDDEDFVVSYSYAAVMGTGTYKIDGRRISQLAMPFSLTTRHMTDDEFGMKWYLPVTIGFDEVTGNSWLDNVFDEDLVIVTAMPGFEAHLPVDDTWTIKPFGNLGGGFDFTQDETILMGALGLRSLGTWRYDSGAEFRLGLAGRVVGEYQFNSTESSGFTMLEAGVDYRRNTGFQLLERKVNAGIYYVLQYYLPLWDITDTPLGDSEIGRVQELGVSLGLREPRKIFGIRIPRVRVGYKRGSAFRGWSFGTEFPF